MAQEPDARRLSEVTGFVHSLESMGAADGPGVRAVVFLQGCSLRCRYCHNPDTWSMPTQDGAGAPAVGHGAVTLQNCGGPPLQSGAKQTAARVTTAGALVAWAARYKPYFGAAGGITFSGGEPLLQPRFLAAALALCKAQGIHTCLDTAGVGAGEYSEILRSTDLVLYDVKHWQPEEYQALTGKPMEYTRDFLCAAAKAGVPLWVRHVVVPGLTDSDEAMAALAAYVRELPNVQRVELLAYHTLGVHKYQELGIPYPLAAAPPMDKARCRAWEREWFSEINQCAGGICQ